MGAFRQHCQECHQVFDSYGELVCRLCQIVKPPEAKEAAPSGEDERLAEDALRDMFAPIGSGIITTASFHEAFKRGLRKGRAMERAELTEHIQAERMYTDSWKKDAERLREQVDASRGELEEARQLLDYQRKAESTVAELLATVLGEYETALKAAGEALRWGSGQHYECDDGWYSCPMAENYIQDDKGSQCNCGFEERRKARELVSEALSAGRRILEGK